MGAVPGGGTAVRRDAHLNDVGGGKMAANADVVREIYGAMERGAHAEVLGGLTDDIEWVEPDGTLPPPGGSGVHRGRRDVLEGVLEVIPRRWTRLAPTVDRTIEAGDDVVVLGRYDAVALGAGHATEIAFVHVWTLRDGRVARLVESTHTSRVMSALGHHDGARSEPLVERL
jgi:ketosteroid isomerase-like protein